MRGAQAKALRLNSQWTYGSRHKGNAARSSRNPQSRGDPTSIGIGAVVALAKTQARRQCMLA
jgi:hypothetical protein